MNVYTTKRENERQTAWWMKELCLKLRASLIFALKMKPNGFVFCLLCVVTDYYASSAFPTTTTIEKYLHIPILLDKSYIANKTYHPILLDTIMRAFQREEQLLPQPSYDDEQSFALANGEQISAHYTLRFRPAIITASNNYMSNVKRLCSYVDGITKLSATAIATRLMVKTGNSSAQQQQHLRQHYQHALLTTVNLSPTNEAASYASATFSATVGIPLLEYTMNYDFGETRYTELFRKPNKRIMLSPNAKHVASSIAQLISNQMWNNTFALLTDMSMSSFLFREQFEHLFGRYWLASRAFTIEPSSAHFSATSSRANYVTQLLQKLRRGGSANTQPNSGSSNYDGLDSYPKQYLILFGSENLVHNVMSAGERLYRESINVGEKITPFTYIVASGSTLLPWTVAAEAAHTSVTPHSPIEGHSFEPAAHQANQLFRSQVTVALDKLLPADRVLTFSPTPADISIVADFVPVAIASSLSMLTGDELALLFGGGAGVDSNKIPNCWSNTLVQSRIPNHYIQHLIKFMASSTQRVDMAKLFVRKLDYVRVQQQQNLPLPANVEPKTEESVNADSMPQPFYPWAPGHIRRSGSPPAAIYSSRHNYSATLMMKNLASSNNITGLPLPSATYSGGDLVRRQWVSIGHVSPNGIQFYADAFEKASPLFMPLIRAHRQIFTIATMRSPPFVDLDFTYADFDGSVTCHHGVECIEPNLTANAVRNQPYPENLLTILAYYKRSVQLRSGELTSSGGSTAADGEIPHIKSAPNGNHQQPTETLYTPRCCHGLSIDLLMKLSDDLEFDHIMYIVPPPVRRPAGKQRKQQIIDVSQTSAADRIVKDLQHGAAHMAFTSLSITKRRERVIDFSLPYFYSSFSSLKWAERKSVKLSAFLEPFSYKLWLCIFAALHTTGIAAAIFEWISPFGLNPWGRQRAKNFSLATALTTVYSLFFNHVIAFKAPKSWPNKVLINFWGSFCFVVLASYTANFAAIYAGIDQRISSVDIFADIHNKATSRIGVVSGSTAESYIKTNYPVAYAHIKSHVIYDLADGVEQLRTGHLQSIVYDEPLLRYVAAMDPKCRLRRAGRSFGDEGYGVGFSKQFPFRDTLSLLVLKYMREGYLDDLQTTWFGHLPCEGRSISELIDPRQLGFDDFAGVFLLLAVGVTLGIAALACEHLVYKALPRLRASPSNSIWRNRHIMFVSQKLYRFINQVDLVSPNMVARELASSLKQGQFIGMFQKSVKKKAREQQLMQQKERNVENFFEMVRDLTRMQRESSVETCPANIITSVDTAGDEDLDGLMMHTTTNDEKTERLSSPTGVNGGGFLKPLVEEDEDMSRRSSLVSQHDCYVATAALRERMCVVENEKHAGNEHLLSIGGATATDVISALQRASDNQDAEEAAEKAGLVKSVSRGSFSSSAQQQTRRASRPLLELVGKQERIEQADGSLAISSTTDGLKPSQPPTNRVDSRGLGSRSRETSLETTFSINNDYVETSEIDAITNTTTTTTQSSSGQVSFERSTTSNSDEHNNSTATGPVISVNRSQDSIIRRNHHHQTQPTIKLGNSLSSLPTDAHNIVINVPQSDDKNVTQPSALNKSGLFAATGGTRSLTVSGAKDLRRRSVAGTPVAATASGASPSPSVNTLPQQHQHHSHALPQRRASSQIIPAARRASAVPTSSSLSGPQRHQNTSSALTEWSDEQLAVLTKQDLLGMWQNSECDLRSQLQRLEREKNNLELKLATQYEQRLRSRRFSKDWV